MSAIPPSRYLVIERGRRLVVIDRASGREVSGSPPDALAPRGLSSESAAPSALLARLVPIPQQEGFDGRATLVTQRFYDDRGPRTLKLDARGAALVGRAKLVAAGVGFVGLLLAIAWPWLFAVPLLLLNDQWRKPPRRWLTGWLDRYDDARTGR